MGKREAIIVKLGLITLSEIVKLNNPFYEIIATSCLISLQGDGQTDLGGVWGRKDISSAVHVCLPEVS